MPDWNVGAGGGLGALYSEPFWRRSPLEVLKGTSAFENLVYQVKEIVNNAVPDPLSQTERAEQARARRLAIDAGNGDIAASRALYELLPTALRRGLAVTGYDPQGLDGIGFVSALGAALADPASVFVHACVLARASIKPDNHIDPAMARRATEALLCLMESFEIKTLPLEAAVRFTDSMGKPGAVVPEGAPSMTVLRAEPAKAASAEGRALVERMSPLASPIPMTKSPDPSAVRSVLMADFPWMEGAIETLCQDLRAAKRYGVPHLAVAPTLLVGPPGCGKSQLVKRFAEIAGAGYSSVSAEAVDGRLIRGTARGYSTATPCYALCEIARTGVANPVVVIDEIEKGVPDGRADQGVADSILGFLEPHTARRFVDQALLVEADLSAVNWLFTANSLKRLNPALMSRLRIVECGPPRACDFDALVTSILAGIAGEYGHSQAILPEIGHEAMAAARRLFSLKPDIRRLVRALRSAVSIETPSEMLC